MLSETATGTTLQIPSGYRNLGQDGILSLRFKSCICEINIPAGVLVGQFFKLSEAGGKPASLIMFAQYASKIPNASLF